MSFPVNMGNPSNPTMSQSFNHRIMRVDKLLSTLHHDGLTVYCPTRIPYEAPLDFHAQHLNTYLERMKTTPNMHVVVSQIIDSDPFGAHDFSKTKYLLYGNYEAFASEAYGWNSDSVITKLTPKSEGFEERTYFMGDASQLMLQNICNPNLKMRILPHPIVAEGYLRLIPGPTIESTLSDEVVRKME